MLNVKLQLSKQKSPALRGANQSTIIKTGASPNDQIQNISS